MAVIRSSIMTLMLAAATKLALSAVSCPNGDTAGVIRDAKTCSELVTDSNAECYDSAFEMTCCASCNAVATSDSNCLYGDMTSCFSFLCASYSDPSECCETCAHLITTISTVTTSTSTMSTTSTTLSTSTTATTSATSKTEDSSVMTSTSDPNKNESSNDRAKGGIIAGAVAGSFVGVFILVGGAFIAVKVFKKKDNKVEDETNSDISSVIPEKLDKYPTSAPERLDICTVLQEKLETNSDIPNKLENYSIGTTCDATITTNPHEHIADYPVQPNNGNNINVDKNNSDERETTEHANKLSPNTDEIPEIKDAQSGLSDISSPTSVNCNDIGDKDDTRRFRLPPLQETHPHVPHIYERLLPIGASANNVDIHPNVPSVNK